MKYILSLILFIFILYYGCNISFKEKNAQIAFYFFVSSNWTFFIENLKLAKKSESKTRGNWKQKEKKEKAKAKQYKAYNKLATSLGLSLV